MGKWVETMIEPTTVYAGDTLTWTREVPGYAAPEWTLNYALVKAGKLYTFSSTPQGAAHQVAVASSVTATWQAGEYTLTPYVTRSGERVTLPGAMRLMVKANPLGAAVDPRSHARRTLDAINAVMEGRATDDVAAYQINGRSLTKMPIADLIAFQSHYRHLVAAEDKEAALEQGFGTNSRIRVRFTK
jgi:hypothetical protein